MRLVLELVIFFACLLYIFKRWNEAKAKRDTEWSLRIGAGSILDEKKPSAFWYLFK